MSVFWACLKIFLFGAPRVLHSYFFGSPARDIKESTVRYGANAGVNCAKRNVTPVFHTGGISRKFAQRYMFIIFEWAFKNYTKKKTRWAESGEAGSDMFLRHRATGRGSAETLGEAIDETHCGEAVRGARVVHVYNF